MNYEGYMQGLGAPAGLNVRLSKGRLPEWSPSSPNAAACPTETEFLTAKYAKYAKIIADRLPSRVFPSSRISGISRFKKNSFGEDLKPNARLAKQNALGYGFGVVANLKTIAAEMRGKK
jgi:hypothetical protein